MQEPNKILRSLQTSSKELSLSDSQQVDFVELALNPQTESKRNTRTTISNLHKVIFVNITISTIKTSVDIKKYIYKYTDNQVHIKFTLSYQKVCVDVKSEKQKRFFIRKANIVSLVCIAETLSSPFETLIL